MKHIKFENFRASFEGFNLCNRTTDKQDSKKMTYV